jgi:hypothetical protein
MLTNLFVFTAVGALAFLCLWELRRYRLAAEDASIFPYPRSRLIRRELTSLIGIAVLLGLAFRPRGLTTGQELIWYGGCLVLTFVVLFLALRDLRESSAAAVEAHRRFQAQTAAQLEELFDEAHKPRGKPRPRRR